jgi:TM2 domain-containing membrane protein YozV
MPPTDEIYYIDADLATIPPGGAGKDRTPRPGYRRGRNRSLLSDTTVTRVGGRRPLVAASLSLLLCGAGQLFNGRRDLALLYFLTEALFFSTNWFLLKMWGFVVETLSLFSIRPTDIMFVILAANYVFLVFLVLNVFQAYKDASGGAPAEPLRQPLISAPASLLVPGWGQMLNGEPRKGALVLGVFLTGGYAFVLSLFFESIWRLWDSSYQMIFGFELTTGGVVALSVAVMAFLYGFYDALLVARRQRLDTL